MLAPIADSAGATLLAGLVGLLVGFPEIDGHPKSARAPSLVAASLGVAAYVASAVYGFDNATRCEAAVDAATSTQAVIPTHPAVSRAKGSGESRAMTVASDPASASARHAGPCLLIDCLAQRLMSQ